MNQRETLGLQGDWRLIPWELQNSKLCEPKRDTVGLQGDWRPIPWELQNSKLCGTTPLALKPVSFLFLIPCPMKSNSLFFFWAIKRKIIEADNFFFKFLGILGLGGYS